MANASIHVVSVFAQGDSGGATPTTLAIFAEVCTEANFSFNTILGINQPFNAPQSQIKLNLTAAAKQLLSDNGYPVEQNDTLFILGI